MGSVRARRRAALGLVCLSILVGTAPRINSQGAGNSEVRFQTIRSWIDAGRYAEAEAEAEGLISTLEKAQDVGSLQLARATDLFVKALTPRWQGIGAADTVPCGTDDSNQGSADRAQRSDDGAEPA